MATNIQTIEDTLESFNQGQFENVTYYNTYKCTYQRNIASYIDSLKCFSKYYDYTDQTAICTGCESDLKGMCMSGGEYSLKEYTRDNAQVSESQMAERRKYCEFDNDEYDIEWSINQDNDANSTLLTPNWDNTLSVTCPNDMIIQSIYFRGSGNYPDGTTSSDGWIYSTENYPFIYKSTGTTWTDGNSQCENIESNLISIHNDDTTSIIETYYPDNDYWIGLNDYANEADFIWSDGTSYDYYNWESGEPRSGTKTCKRFLGVFKKKCTTHGKNDDAVWWTRDGWDDRDGSSESALPLCANPNINFGGIDSMSSFMETIDSVSCIQANRGPIKECQDFYFSNVNFGDDNSNAPYNKFNCENAQSISGFDGSAWFLSGLLFEDDSGLLSSVIGVRCCLIPGTVYNYDSNDTVPDFPGHIDAYGDTDVEINNLDDYLNDFFGISSITRGSEQSVQGFTFRSISDYIPNSCSLDNSNGNADYCMSNRVGIVDYENIIETEDGIKPNIDISKFECGDGCDPDITNECSNEYIEDNALNNGNVNPFVQEFECSNINYTKAIMDKYSKCFIYPVYPALFYDYDVDLHRQMIVLQFDPYMEAMGSAMLKLWQTVFIIIFIKVFVFPIYFRIEEEISSKCCDAIRLKRVVQVEVAKELTVAQLDALNAKSPFIVPMSPGAQPQAQPKDSKGNNKTRLRSNSVSLEL